MQFQKLIDKISDAFSILDFSYIISGGLIFLIILFDLHKHCQSFMLENMLATVICGIFLSYICGLFSWMLGKFIRRNIIGHFYMKIGEDFQKIFNETIDMASVSLPEFKKTNNGSFLDIFSLTYEYMWIRLENVKEAHERVNYINRFWVMQAVYEGLIGALFIAIVVLIDLFLIGELKSVIWLVLLLVLMLFIIVFCVWEARECARTQIKEVILSYRIYVLNDKIEVNHEK